MKYNLRITAKIDIDSVGQATISDQFIGLDPVAVPLPVPHVSPDPMPADIPEPIERIFPAGDPWYRNISAAPIHPSSQRWAALFDRAVCRAEFGAEPDPDTGLIGGIPICVVGPDQPLALVRIRPEPGEGAWEYGQSDLYPDHERMLPIPMDAPREGGPGASDDNYDHDRHIIVLQCEANGIATRLFELWHTRKLSDANGKRIGWECAHISIWDCSRVTPQRPLCKTSADAAGLPIAPALFSSDQMQAAMDSGGDLGHALRFTLPAGWINRAFMPPATCPGKQINPIGLGLPPLGARARLRADFSLDAAMPDWLKEDCANGAFDRRMGDVLVRTLQRYGMFLADIGGTLMIAGQPGPGWKDSEAEAFLNCIKGSDLEFIAGPVYAAADLKMASAFMGLPVWDK